MSKLAGLKEKIKGGAVLVGAALLTIFSAFFVYGQYGEVQRQSAEIQTRIFRDTIAVFSDLWHVEHTIGEIELAGFASDDALFELSQRIDFLFVRTDGLRAGAQSVPGAAERVDEVISGLNEIIALADEALSVEVFDPKDFLANTQPMFEDVSKLLLDLFDLQYFRQSEAISAQVDVIQKLTYTAVAMLCLFGAFGAGLVFLLHRQLSTQVQRQEAEEKANFLAFFDGLTGLPNRTKFRTSAENLVEANADPVVFLFDLDDFKLVNDIHGHQAGDAVLMRCASCIEVWCEELGGTPSRLGGDEFAAVIPGPMSSMKIASLCERLLASVTEPFEFESSLLSPRMSIGVAASWSMEEEEALDLGALQKAADIALYRAKEQGKNTYAFFDSDLAEMAARRRDIEIGIDEALKSGGFLLAYQPQVEMASGEIKGFEALARWNRNGTPVSPAEFISVAESTGQVVEIDVWGLRESTRQVAEWIREGKVPVTISANLSPLHFRNEDIVGHVREALSQSGLPPHLLTLEITESVLIEDLSKVTATLEKLRRLGVRIALDDFGTGYSSLAYLRRLDVDCIKIDQSFVRDLEQSSETQIILDALVDIAKGLKKMLVVEGIETEAQATIIRDLGCDIGQGYLWGKPMPSAEAAELLLPVSAVLDRVKAN